MGSRKLLTRGKDKLFVNFYMQLSQNFFVKV